MTAAPVIEVRDLHFAYRGDPRPVLAGVNLSVAQGRRVLLIGANGAGKTTLLRILAGKHMVEPDRVRVLGLPAFHDPTLGSRIEFLGGRFPFEVDLRVDEILARQIDPTGEIPRPAGKAVGVPTPRDAASPIAVDPARCARLIDVLGVDVGWHMHAVSDGQRRRVQLLLGLLRPREVLLLDEITTDLDLIARQDLLALLREETEARKTTIVYATHIFDTLDRWATDILYLVAGKVVLDTPMAALPELGAEPLVAIVERWLRRDTGKP